MATKILLGFQHIFVAFGGIIVVPLVISSALGFDPATSIATISASILAAGIATIIQARGVGRVGYRVVLILNIILRQDKNEENINQELDGEVI